MNLNGLRSGSAALSADVYSAVAPVYIAFSVASIFLTMAVNVIYWSSKRLQRDHASTLINTITIADLAYTLKFFVGAVTWMLNFRDERASFHLVPDNCRFSAAYGQFTGMACIGWNAVWMYDLITALSNPLTNTAALRRWYHIAVWTIAIASTIGVAASPIPETADDHTCRPSAVTPAGLLFILPLFGAMGLALLSLTYAFLRLSGNSSSSSGRNSKGKAAQLASIRRSLRNRHTAYVVAFILLWAWPLLHDYLDEDDTNIALTVMDAVAVSGQAGVFAAIRLSEPGAAAMFRALMRRLYRALFVYPCALCVRGKSAADQDAEFERAALMAALERSASQSSPSKASAGVAGYSNIEEGSASLKRARLSRQDSGLGVLPGWLRRAWHSGGKGPESESASLLAAGAAGKLGDPSQRAAAARLLDSAVRRPSFDAESGQGASGSGVGYGVCAGSSHTDTADSEEQGEDRRVEGEERGQEEGAAEDDLSSFSGERNLITADLARSTSWRENGGLFAALGRALGGNRDSGQGNGRTGGIDQGEEKGIALLDADHTGGSSADGGRRSLRVLRPALRPASAASNSSPSQTAGGGGAAASQRLSSSFKKPAASPPVAKETSFALAEAAALGSGWDVASAAGLRVELGSAMLAALVQSVAAGDARARGGKEASVYALRKPMKRGRGKRVPGLPTPREEGDAEEHDVDEREGGTGSLRARGRTLSGSGEAAAKAAAVALQEGSSDSEGEFSGGGKVMLNPAAPDSRRNIRTWMRDPTSVHLTVNVRSPLIGPDSKPTQGLQQQHSEEEEEEEDLLTVDVTSFADADFAYVRRAAAVPPGEVTRGFHPDLLRSGQLRAHFSDGASSSFFCRSLDGALVVKTLAAGEVEMMLRLLPAYARHLADNPESLLVRFYGCFAITLAAGSRAASAAGPTTVGLGRTRIYFTLMSNVFPVAASLSPAGPASSAASSTDTSGGEGAGEQGGPAPVSGADVLAQACGQDGLVVFDLKGSSINRRARAMKEELQPGSASGGGSSAASKKAAGEAGGATGKDGQESAPKAVKSSTLLLDLDLRESFPRGLPLSDPKELFPDPSRALACAADLLAGRERAAAVLDQLRRDVTLLASQGLMDYSLLMQIIPVEGPGCTTTGAGEDSETARQDGRGEGMQAQDSARGGGASIDLVGGVLRVAAQRELSLAQAEQVVQGASNPIKRPAVAPIPGGSSATGSKIGQGLYGAGMEPVGPQLLLPVLTKPGSATAQGISITRWSSLAVSACGLGVVAQPAPTFFASLSGTANTAQQSLAATYPARAVVQIGIVDVLQFYDSTKRLENAFKNLRYGSLGGMLGEADVSAVDPLKYAVRFTDFISKVLGVDS